MCRQHRRGDQSEREQTCGGLNSESAGAEVGRRGTERARKREREERARVFTTSRGRRGEIRNEQEARLQSPCSRLLFCILTAYRSAGIMNMQIGEQG
jgi:hypothetical protein